MLKSLAKTMAVVVGSTVLATLAVNALDTGGDFSRSMLGSVFVSEVNSVTGCPNNMVLVTQALIPFCIDMYEASPSENCTYTQPNNEDQTAVNLSVKDCKAESASKEIPWRNISQSQAEQACSKAGKRLPTANEWYKAALGTPDFNEGWTEEHCNVSNNRADGIALTGGGIRCVSDAGAYDMIGNAWEWIAETVDHSAWKDKSLPDTGFVQGVDVDGIAYETGNTKDEMFSGDRFWSDSAIVSGMMRGGYYDSSEQAGVYATYAASPPTFSGEAVGFRCVVSKM